MESTGVPHLTNRRAQNLATKFVTAMSVPNGYIIFRQLFATSRPQGRQKCFSQKRKWKKRHTPVGWVRGGDSGPAKLGRAAPSFSGPGHAKNLRTNLWLCGQNPSDREAGRPRSAASPAARPASWPPSSRRMVRGATGGGAEGGARHSSTRRRGDCSAFEPSLPREELTAATCFGRECRASFSWESLVSLLSNFKSSL